MEEKDVVQPIEDRSQRTVAGLVHAPDAVIRRKPLGHQVPEGVLRAIRRSEYRDQ